MKIARASMIKRGLGRAKPNEPDGRWEIQEYRFI
jgi:hypothetical protein